MREHLPKEKVSPYSKTPVRVKKGTCAHCYHTIFTVHSFYIPFNCKMNFIPRTWIQNVLLRILFSTIPFYISILKKLHFLLSLRVLLQQCIQSLLSRLSYTVVSELDAQGALDLSGDGVGGGEIILVRISLILLVLIRARWSSLNQANLLQQKL